MSENSEIQEKVRREAVRGFVEKLRSVQDACERMHAKSGCAEIAPLEIPPPPKCLPRRLPPLVAWGQENG